MVSICSLFWTTHTMHSFQSLWQKRNEGRKILPTYNGLCEAYLKQPPSLSLLASRPKFSRALISILSVITIRLRNVGYRSSEFCASILISSRPGRPMWRNLLTKFSQLINSAVKLNHHTVKVKLIGRKTGQSRATFPNLAHHVLTKSRVRTPVSTGNQIHSSTLWTLRFQKSIWEP